MMKTHPNTNTTRSNQALLGWKVFYFVVPEQRCKEVYDALARRLILLLVPLVAHTKRAGNTALSHCIARYTWGDDTDNIQAY